jgi:hypothetical protein
MITPEMLLAVPLAIGYLAIVVFWITNYFSRIEPYLLEKLGNRLGLKIKRVQRRTSYNWHILDKEHTWQQGCLVSIIELLATIFLLIAPFWVLIGIVVGAMLLFSGKS